MTKTTSQIDDILDLAHTISEFTICGEGNVTVRDGNNFKIKASGTSLHKLSEEDLTLCDIYGKQLDETHVPNPCLSRRAVVSRSELQYLAKHIFC